MIVVYDRFGRRLATYDTAREVYEDYPDAVIKNGKAIVESE